MFLEKGYEAGQRRLFRRELLMREAHAKQPAALKIE